MKIKKTFSFQRMTSWINFYYTNWKKKKSTENIIDRKEGIKKKFASCVVKMGALCYLESPYVIQYL